MIRKYKKQLIAASLLTLLPMVLGVLLWKELPGLASPGWGFENSVPVMTFLFVQPPITLAGLWLCVWITSKDNGDQNKKVQSTVLWIIPVLSNLVAGMMFAVSQGAAQAFPRIFLLVFGLMFAVIGNYMPKTRRNSTIGIKVSWALASDENWNATHRFGGRCWFVGGILTMLAACLPEKIGLPLFLVLTLAYILAPMIYSYCYYRKQKREGTAPDVKAELSQKYTKWTMVFLGALLVLVGILMFTGDIAFTYGETALSITADFYSDLEVPYDVIETVEFRATETRGTRTMGYGSGRLLMGTFENDEFGLYTRYSYTGCKSAVVVRSGDRVLVLSGRDDDETRGIYEELTARVKGAVVS